MKKLLLLLGLPLLLSSCCHPDNNKNLTTLTTVSTQVSLNGIPYNDADDMVKRFINNMKNNVKNTKKTSVWFGRDVLEGITDLLINEQNTLKTDGMRVYFAQKADDAYTVVLVSTFNGGINNGKTVHRDYFIHDLPYTALTNVEGVLRAKPSSGERLFAAQDCNGAPESCDADPHFIGCDKAYEMVKWNEKQEVFNSTSEWFDLNLLKILVKSIKDNNGDGVRIYFGKKLLPSTGDAECRTGFVFVATKKNDKGISYDYFDCTSLLVPSKGPDDNGEECPLSCDGTFWHNP